MHARQKIFLALHTAVIVDQDDRIVEQFVQRLGVGNLVGLVSCFLKRDNLALDRGFGRILRE
jgi:hypothetical protein